MTDYIGDYCLHHHTTHNISPRRRVDQLRELRLLEAWLDKPIEQIEAADLEAYISELVDQGKHPHTIKRYIKSLIRPFLLHMYERGLVDEVRHMQISRVKTPRNAYDGKPRPYSPHEMQVFWRDFERKYPWTSDRVIARRTPERGEYWVRRWAAGTSSYRRVYPYAMRLQAEAIVALALYGGLRRTEIFNATLEMLDFNNAAVPVVSRKGANGIEKTRMVPMTNQMRVALGNWLTFRAEVLAPPHDHPWLTLWYGQQSIGALAPMRRTMFVNVVNRIDPNGRWTYHRLRHTFGTERYRAGMPLEVLQRVMGHATLQQTLGYAAISDDTILAVSKRSEDKFEAGLARR